MTVLGIAKRPQTLDTTMSSTSALFSIISCVVIQSSSTDSVGLFLGTPSRKRASAASKKNGMSIMLPPPTRELLLSNNHDPVRSASDGQPSRDDEKTTQTPIERIAACVKPLSAAGRADTFFYTHL
jgi:hypothetical protein